MQFQAVVFDLDGTLLDTLPDIAVAMNTVLQNRGYPTHHSETFRAMLGWGMPELIRRAAPTGVSVRERETMRSELLAEYARKPVEKTVPYRGILEILRGLRAMNIPLAVVTNKADELVETVLRGALPSIDFVEARGFDPNQPRKPDPTSTLDILARVGVEPPAACFVGDSEVDVETAINAGMVSIGVSWGYRPRASLAGADHIVDSAEQLAELLGYTPDAPARFAVDASTT